MHHLTLELKPSRYYCCLILCCYGLAGFCFWTLSWAWWIKAIIHLTLIIYVCYLIKTKVLLQAPHAILRLTHVNKTTWRFVLRSGLEQEAILRSNSYISPWLVILNFRKPKTYKIISVVIFPDAVNKQVFRRLRVLLRFAKL